MMIGNKYVLWIMNDVVNKMASEYLLNFFYIFHGVSKTYICTETANNVPVKVTSLVLIFQDV